MRRYQHQSEELGCSMNFTVFFPPAAAAGGSKVPVRRGPGRLVHPRALHRLCSPPPGACRAFCSGTVGRLKCSAQVIYYLSGLTCTDENFTQKAGAQRKAAELGVALVAPDTSPRGLGIEGEDDGCVGVHAHAACSAARWLTRLLPLQPRRGTRRAAGSGRCSVGALSGVPSQQLLLWLNLAAGTLAPALASTWMPLCPSGSGTACTRTSPASCPLCCAPRRPSWTWRM